MFLPRPAVREKTNKDGSRMNAALNMSLHRPPPTPPQPFLKNTGPHQPPIRAESKSNRIDAAGVPGNGVDESDTRRCGRRHAPVCGNRRVFSRVHRKDRKSPTRGGALTNRKTTTVFGFRSYGTGPVCVLFLFSVSFLRHMIWIH